jgi:N6-adenosine-specific RNA methylase IME4
MADVMVTSADRTLVKRNARNERERQLAEHIRSAHATTPDQPRYGIILADPPWRFEPYSRETGMDRSADNHYPTMRLADICRLKVYAASDAVLFLWRTAPMLEASFSVVTAWGFTYKTEFVWTKPRMGTGYWNRNQHEVLMLATRGNPVAPAPGTQSSSWLHAASPAHSAKPDNFHFMIENLWPATPKVEFFARRRRPGWDYLYSPELPACDSD